MALALEILRHRRDVEIISTVSMRLKTPKAYGGSVEGCRATAGGHIVINASDSSSTVLYCSGAMAME